MRITIFILLILFVPFHNGIAQTKPGSSEKFGVGFEIGNWSPNDLSDNGTLLQTKMTQKYPYWGIMLLKPWRWGMTFRSSLGYWKYSSDKSLPAKKTIEIASILLDLKYDILSDVLLLPYVSYGMGWFFGNDLQPHRSFINNRENLELGIGINVGTGFDLKFSQKFNLAAEFRYHYVKFKRVVVFTDNYSGPKISLEMIYLF